MKHESHAQRTVHELKTWPQYFAAVDRGDKRFELRAMDRDYKVGDWLILNEFDPMAPPEHQFTGRKCVALVTYILTSSEFGALKDGYCILAIEKLNPQMPEEGELEVDARTRSRRILKALEHEIELSLTRLEALIELKKERRAWIREKAELETRLIDAEGELARQETNALEQRERT